MSSPSTSSALGRVAILTLIALIGLAVTMKVLVTPADDGPPHPDSWDARVLPLVAMVEELRGLEFKEPVYVDFLEPAEFRKDVRVEQGELTDEDREEIEQTLGLMRALGLVEGDLDLFNALQELNSGGILAYYTYEEERIRLRGSELTPATTSTLVHELTHALQDQHFGLGARFESYDDDEGTAASLFRALVEGDARRIETVYAAGLPAKEQEALLLSQTQESEDATAKLKDVPTILMTLMSAPYVLGEPLVSLSAAQGNKAVDSLFRDPPRTEEYLLDPLVSGTDESQAIDVATPDLEDGDTSFDQGEFGALTWFLVLGERVPLTDALAAADGWGGDRYVAFERGDTTCFRATFVGDTDQDTSQMGTALQRWVKAVPAGTAEVRTEDGKIHLHSCDPGTDTTVGSDSSEEALMVAAMRSSIGVSLASQQGLSVPIARCYSNRVVQEFTVEELTAPDGGNSKDFQERLGALMKDCV